MFVVLLLGAKPGQFVDEQHFVARGPHRCRVVRVRLPDSSRSIGRRGLRALQATVHDQLRPQPHRLLRPPRPRGSERVSSEQLEGRRAQERTSRGWPEAKRPRAKAAIVLSIDYVGQIRRGHRKIPLDFTLDSVVGRRNEAGRSRGRPTKGDLHELFGRPNDGSRAKRNAQGDSRRSEAGLRNGRLFHPLQLATGASDFDPPNGLQFVL